MRLPTSRELDTMCQSLGADINLEAAIAALHFILTHAAKYDIERADLVEELQQLGFDEPTTQAIAQNYETQRVRIQEQQRAHRFRFPGIKNVDYKVEASSKITWDLKLDQPAVECDVMTTPVRAAPSPALSFDMTKLKFLALYEELSQAQSILHSSV
ncbi:hypothetical protein PsorP6_000983 [Peronosclerospora sorghi]|uniref:Uncharacterized protein n=1 Tax=Peronosclerospora sorghi TaxID=230839 RepID=A0ACC0WRN1_9STRA|nr:hypothetical protein PsorP6_000983 [Peronosclerospora sorghi]